MIQEVATVVYLVTDTAILLGKKKRGWGAGFWNGFGGKVQSDETPEEAARREVFEESGIRVETLVPIGCLIFSYPEKIKEIKTHIFITSEFTGEPIETDEMSPHWFLFDEIPYDYMWEDDREWLPLVLSGMSVSGTYVFDAKNKIVAKNLKQEKTSL